MMNLQKIFLFFCLLLSLPAFGIELVNSKCDWKPPPPTMIAELTKNIEPKFSTASNPSDDEFKVKLKGRTYFYSLSNKSCKTDIFIIFGDQVSAIDFYPNRSGIFTDYARVVYFSKNLKKEISGWVEMSNLCRITLKGNCI